MPDQGASALLSPDNKWLSVQSYTGHDPSGLLDLYPSIGRVYFEVFNANTGKSAFAVKGTYNGFDPGEIIQRLVGCHPTPCWYHSDILEVNSLCVGLSSRIVDRGIGAGRLFRYQSLRGFEKIHGVGPFIKHF